MTDQSNDVGAGQQLLGCMIPLFITVAVLGVLGYFMYTQDRRLDGVERRMRMLEDAQPASDQERKVRELEKIFQ